MISILEQTSSRLDINAVPDSLPCRESEYQNIFTFIEDKINHNTGGCLYISGVPGTGKTATTQEVVAALREEVNQGMNDKILLYYFLLIFRTPEKIQIHRNQWYAYDDA